MCTNFGWKILIGLKVMKFLPNILNFGFNQAGNIIYTVPKV